MKKLVMSAMLQAIKAAVDWAIAPVDLEEVRKRRRRSPGIILKKKRASSSNQDPLPVLGRVLIWLRDRFFNLKWGIMILKLVVIMLVWMMFHLIEENRQQEAIIKSLILAEVASEKDWLYEQRKTYKIEKVATVMLGMLKTIGLAFYLAVNPFGPILIM